MWTELACPEGVLYVDLEEVAAIGPSIVDGVAGHMQRMRLLYLVGGSSLVILDTAENAEKLFGTKGTTH